ncbi:hypothetical protein B0H16DRAFT_1809232 [Mycena metata]|uniref:Uncharacterized protein n=1 Tax=Mycena metata TaxID=1033252 RepID=A0AAD7H7G8_9AGAR|nr:hypothetical protein B0H16DRAFT_1809232 [Mycena metata]
MVHPEARYPWLRFLLAASVDVVKAIDGAMSSPFKKTQISDGEMHRITGERHELVSPPDHKQPSQAQARAERQRSIHASEPVAIIFIILISRDSRWLRPLSDCAGNPPPPLPLSNPLLWNSAASTMSMKFTAEQATHIASYLPALMAKSRTSTTSEMTAYKELISTTILQSPVFLGKLLSNTEDAWKKAGRLLKKFSNDISRKTSDGSFIFYPISGIQLFEREQRNADPDDQLHETITKLWGGLSKELRDRYKVRAAELPIGVESINSHGPGNAADMVEVSGQPFVEQWIQFAEQSIPSLSVTLHDESAAEIVIPCNLSGIPVFPAVELKHVSQDSLTRLLTAYLDQLWDCTGPSLRRSETDLNLYHDRRFAPPVDLNDLENMSLTDIFFLARFFVETSVMGSPDPFVFQQSQHRSPTPETPPSQNDDAASVPQNREDSEQAVQPPQRKKPRVEKKRTASPTAGLTPDEGSIATRRRPRQPVPKQSTIAIPSNGKKPGFDITLMKADEMGGEA